MKKRSGKIEIGAGKTYKNLDALVFALKEDFIPAQYRDDTKLVAIMGSDLLADKYFPLINQEKPSEILAGDTVISQNVWVGYKPYLSHSSRKAQC